MVALSLTRFWTINKISFSSVTLVGSFGGDIEEGGDIGGDIGEGGDLELDVFF